MADRALAAEFVLRCFHARTAAHLLHLKTRSFAEHKALNDFYDGIVPLVDEFAESYQGEEGLITGYKPGFAIPTDALKLLNDLDEWIEDNREGISCGDSALGNLVDNVSALIDQTIYKLRFLS